MKPAVKMIKRALSFDPRAFVSAFKTGQAIRQNYDNMGKQSSISRGFSGSSLYSGKFKKPIFRKKRQKINGKWTSHGIAMQGITLDYESRKSVSGTEAVAVGHTTMPGQVCTMMFWRAVVKFIMVKLGCHLKDYGSSMIGYGFVVGDQFVFSYYGFDPAANSPSNVVVNLTSDYTFDKLAAEFDRFFANFGPEQLRLDAISFVPFNSGILSSYSKWGAASLELNNAKISVTCKSKLSIKNVTIENATDVTVDDIDSIPLNGKIFKTKGNNLLRKSNRATLPGLFNAKTDDALFESYSKQAGTAITSPSLDVRFINDANSTETTFFRPAEPPRDMDIKNLIGTNYVVLQPGSIKDSVLFNTFEMSVTGYWELIYFNKTHRPGPTDHPYYNANLGTCQTVVLEKVIGRKPNAFNDIKLWIQLQYTQSALIHGKMNRYTDPIQFQTDYD